MYSPGHRVFSMLGNPQSWPIRGLLLRIALQGAVFLALGTGVLAAQEDEGAAAKAGCPPTTLRLATGAKDGTYQHLGEAIKEVLATAEIGVCVENSNGSSDNLRRLQAGDADLALAQLDVVFHQNRLGNGNWELLLALTAEPVQIVKAPSGDSENLNWNKLLLPTTKSGARITADWVVGALKPSSFREITDQVGASWNGMMTHLTDKNRTYDAAFFVSSIPKPQVAYLLANPDFHLRSFDESDYKTLEKLGGKLFPYLRYRIPARTYSNQTADVTTLAVLAVLLSRARNFPGGRETTQKITAALLKDLNGVFT